MAQYRDAIRADAATIVDFQLAMARETEEVALDRDVVTRGVAAVFDDRSRGRYFVAEKQGTAAPCRNRSSARRRRALHGPAKSRQIDPALRVELYVFRLQQMPLQLAPIRSAPRADLAARVDHSMPWDAATRRQVMQRIA